jgi:hypothetical protein
VRDVADAEDDDLGRQHVTEHNLSPVTCAREDLRIANKDRRCEAVRARDAIKSGAGSRDIEQGWRGCPGGGLGDGKLELTQSLPPRRRAACVWNPISWCEDGRGRADQLTPNVARIIGPVMALELVQSIRFKGGADIYWRQRVYHTIQRIGNSGDCILMTS